MDKTSELRKRSLRYSIHANTAWAVMAGFGDSFFSAFAVFLNATALQLSLLGTLPSLLGASSQLFCHRILTRLKSRRTFIYRNIAGQALMYLPIASVPLLPAEMRVPCLLLFISLYSIIGMIYMPAWNSWMGDMLEDSERGRFFGKRNNLGTIVQFASFLTAGQILEWATTHAQHKMAGFATLFLIAMTARLLSSFFMAKKWEPEYHPEAEKIYTPKVIFTSPALRHYKQFVITIGLTSFFGGISAPFGVPYLLKDVGLSYWQFTIVVGAAMVFRFLTMPVWGRLADLYGSRKVMLTAGAITLVTPLLWFVSRDFYYLVALHCLSGFVFAGYEIAISNYLYDVNTPTSRVTTVAYFNLTAASMAILGALLGGILVKQHLWGDSAYLSVFPIASAGRLLVVLLFMSRLAEIRRVREVPSARLFLHVIAGMPTTEYAVRLFNVVRNNKLLKG